MKIASKVWNWGVLAGRILAGLLFIYSGSTKLLQLSEYFEFAIGLYSLFPETIIPLISHVLPWVELICGTFLLAGYWIEGSAGILALATLGFETVIGQAFM